MNGFEQQISGIGSDHSTSWATTTALVPVMFDLIIYLKHFKDLKLRASEEPFNGKASPEGE